MVPMPDQEQNRATHLEPDGTVSEGAPRDAFGAEMVDPNEPYDLVDPVDEAIDQELAQQLEPWAGEENFEGDYQEAVPTVDEAVQDAIGETVVSPQQRAQVADLIEQRPEIGSAVAIEAMEGPYEEIIEQYGLAAVTPDLIENLYDQLDAQSGGQLTAQAEDESARAGIMQYAKVGPDGKRKDVYS
jgi:hypothetical protein